MEATRSEDAPNPSNYQEMDPDRRRFLEEALKSLTIDVVQELDKAVKNIMDAPDANDEDLVDSFEVISNYIQDIDSANDFYKVGGFCVLDKGIDSSNNRVRSATIGLIADLAQNNPFCQQKFLEMNTLNKLVDLLTDPSSISFDAMRAISCIVRSYEPCLLAFVSMGGLECILGCITDNSRAKLQTRIAFLISNINVDHPEVAGEMVKLNAVERIGRLLDKNSKSDLEDSTTMSKMENLLRALTSFCDIPSGRERAKDPSLNLKHKLEQLSLSVAGKEEYLEVTDFCREIINKCFGDDNKNEIADR